MFDVKTFFLFSGELNVWVENRNCLTFNDEYFIKEECIYQFSWSSSSPPHEIFNAGSSTIISLSVYFTLIYERESIGRGKKNCEGSSIDDDMTWSLFASQTPPPPRERELKIEWR